MKQIFVLLLCLLFLMILCLSVEGATTYYFDKTNGNDGGGGESEDDAYQSLTKLNALQLGPGDTVKFKRGEIWHGSATPNANGEEGNPVTFDAYGNPNDPLPIISGEAFITGDWKNTSGTEEYSIGLDVFPYSVFASQTNLMDCVLVEPEKLTDSGVDAFKQENDEFGAHRGDLANTKVWYLKSVAMKSGALFDNFLGYWTRLTERNCPPNLTTLQVGEYCFDLDNFETPQQNGWRLYFSASTGENPSLGAYDHIYITSQIAGSLPPNGCYYDKQTKRLHVRMADGGAPEDNEISYLGEEFNMKFTDASHLAIKNIQFEKSHTKSIWFRNTGNQSDYILDSVVLKYIGLEGVKVEMDNNTTLDDLIIQNSIFQIYPTRFWNVITGDFGVISVGNQYTEGTRKVNNIKIKNNLIDGGRQEVYDGCGDYTDRLHCDRNGIMLFDPKNVEIIGNKITGIDHAAYISGGGLSFDCTPVEVSYNYIHDIKDDAIWGLQKCGGDYNSPQNYMYHSNLAINVGDDCIALDAGSVTKISFLNNVCINMNNDCIKLRNTDAIAKNNICIRTVEADCQNEDRCFVELQFDVSQLPDGWNNVDHNLYFDTTGSDGGDFKYCIITGNDTSTCYDSAQYYSFDDWKQAFNADPDLNSIYNVDPQIDSMGYPLNEATVLNNGADVCSLGLDGLLTEGATWNVGVPVYTYNPCPVTETDKIDIGAYRISRANDDSDNDGMPDYWEIQYGLDPYNLNDADEDILDSDGLTNLEEYLAGTDPTDSDTDNDGMADGNEICPLESPVNISGTSQFFSTLQAAYDAAVDNDLILSQYEYLNGTLNADQDKPVNLEAGYDCNYINNSGETTIKGELNVNSGTLNINSGTLNVE